MLLLWRHVAAVGSACIMRWAGESERLGVKKVKATKVRSGPRAPTGKAPLQILVTETMIDEAKIKAIREKTKVSRVVDELLRGWLDGTYKLKS